MKKNISNKLISISISTVLLAAMGCGPANDKRDDQRLMPPTGAMDSGTSLSGNQSSTGGKLDKIPAELPESKITRECSDSEFSQLVTWSNLVSSANTAIDTINGKKDSNTIKTAATAVKSCDQVSEYHKASPCRKTKKTIISTDVKFYDQARVMKRCEKLTQYLVKYDARPVSGAAAVTNKPTAPVVNPQPNPAPVIVDNGQSADVSRQCTADEFSKLSAMSAIETKANNAIKTLGSQTSWKYDSNAISSAALLVKSCEALIQYHSAQPCQKSIKQTDGSSAVRQYTGATLRSRCETARTYFYEFVQNQTTLNFKNADLYIDFSTFPEKILTPGYAKESFGACIVENKSQNTVQYGNGLVLLKDSRASIENHQIVFETHEGVLIQCYGLNIEGPFSKREIERVLREEKADIRLTYKLK